MEKIANIGTMLSLPDGLERVRDLEWYDGPLITEFRGIENDRYLFIWRDSDDRNNRWLVLRITRRDLALFMSKQASLLQLLHRPMDGFMFLVDVNSDGVRKRTSIVTLDKLPPDYLPEPDSFYDPDLAPPGAATDKQAILIDGEWEIGDLSTVPRRYKEVYDFLYLLAAKARNILPNSAFSYRFKGGYVHHAFYKRLGAAVPRHDRVRLTAFQYASPGVIEISANPSVANIVAAAVRGALESDGELHELYLAVYRWLHAKTPEARASRVPLKVFSRQVQELADGLGYIDYQKLRSVAESVEQTAHVLLSYTRRLRRLVKYQQEGMATITETSV